MAAVNRNKVTNTSPVGQSVGVNGKGYGLGNNLSVRGKATAWQPTVVYLLVLVVAEMFAYCGLRYAFRQVHGG